MHDKIRTFIQKNLVVFDDEATFSNHDNIFAMGFVNSLFAMKLVAFVEREFGLSVENEDLDISNFSSVNNIVNFITGKTV